MGSKHQPDMTAAAREQGAANVETARTQSLLNNPNMVTPYGNQTYVMGPDGRPTMTQTLSPEEMEKYGLRSQAEISALGILNKDMPNIEAALMGPFGLAGSPLTGGWAPGTDPGRAQTSLDFSGAPPMPVADEAARQAAVEASYRQAARFLDPQFQQEKDRLDAMLANQGIVRNPGDPESAWAQEQQNLGRTREMAYANARDEAVRQGLQALESMFGMGLAARQQGVGEATTQGQFQQSGTALNAQIAQALARLIGDQRGQAYSEYSANRTMPLNMLNALLSSSQINNPTFQATQPTNIIPPPIFQGAYAQAQQNAAGGNSWMGLLGSLLGAGGMALSGGGLGALMGR